MMPHTADALVLELRALVVFDTDMPAAHVIDTLYCYRAVHAYMLSVDLRAADTADTMRQAVMTIDPDHFQRAWRAGLATWRSVHAREPTCFRAVVDKEARRQWPITSPDLEAALGELVCRHAPLRARHWHCLQHTSDRGRFG